MKSLHSRQVQPAGCQDWEEKQGKKMNLEKSRDHQTLVGQKEILMMNRMRRLPHAKPLFAHRDP